MNEIVIQRWTPDTTQAAEGLGRRPWTVDEIIRLQEMGVFGGIDRPRERFELIGGEIVPMASKGNWHEDVKRALNRHWVKAATPEIELITETTYYISPKDFLEPDFFIWPAQIRLKDIAAPTALLIAEVADSSLAYDTGRKARIYASLGLREYWAVNARTLVTRIHREPGAQGFGIVMELGPDELMTPLFAPSLAVRLADLGLLPAAGAE